jgi:hypothetical protein
MTICLLDALDILMADTEAEFYPQHDDFKYSRIGVTAKSKDGFPQFEPHKDSRVPLVGLKWSDTRLNLSVLAKIAGTIELPVGYDKVGLYSQFETFVWRNYALVKDGSLNVQKLPVTLSKESYDKFLAEGIIDKEHNRHYKGHAYTLHLDRMSVINDDMANNRTSALDLAKKALDETKHEANLKVLNYVRCQIEPKEARGLGLNVSPEQEEFLKAVGVTKNGFAPPTEKGEPTDFYMATEFVVAVKGCSSLPKVEDVQKKIADKKTLTASQQFIADGLALVANMPKGLDSKAQLNWLDNVITNEKHLLNKVRSEIQRTKFAVVLSGKQFDGFSDPEDMVAIVDGIEVAFNIKESRVSI